MPVGCMSMSRNIIGGRADSAGWGSRRWAQRCSLPCRAGRSLRAAHLRRVRGRFALWVGGSRAADDQTERPVGLDGHASSKPNPRRHPGREILVARMNQNQGVELMRDGEEPVRLDRPARCRRPCADLDTEESRLACTGASRPPPDRDPGATAPALRNELDVDARSERRTRFEPTPVRPRQPQTPDSRT